MLAVVGVVYFIGVMLEEQPPPKKMIQQVTIIIPPPPPPELEEPEPEVKEEEVIEEEPIPVEAPGEQLGMDSDGGAGGDSFGLAARKGGRDLLGGGYAGMVQQSITELVTGFDKLKHKDYVIIMLLWIKASGELERYEIVQRSGDTEVPKLMELAMAGFDRFNEAPPLEMQQPIKLRIKSQL